MRTHLIHRPARDIFHCSVELGFPPSLIGRLGSSAFRLSTTTVSMSLAGSSFSFGRPCRQSTAEPSRHANSPHPSSREGHLPLLGGARVSSFSNRPFGVKRFQAIHYHSVDVARGLLLLFRAALPSVDGRTQQTCELTSSIVPRGTSSTARWSSGFLLL